MAGTPESIAARWGQNLQAAGPKMTDGANAVTVSPGQLAARASDTWLANTTASVAKYKANSAAVTVDQWRTAYLGKGLQRIAAGVSQAQPKVAAFMTQWLPHMAAGVAALPARGNFEANLARSAAMIRHAHTFSYKKTG
jgi:hypothetical protein